ncbi:hypothetical protein BU25DRAFT_461833 [Macroventuria anomochaeta]|uniref:Uncharacterized protein n=1 Tax=Macroventuria anomochaeta TaxID=301207 RepID=A0ACB6RP01_9PLEO|nr:uncharacterized protein BU25DRAFT_461833 [Macroventuria anomochaeta]KAF2623751.1 hypothetical protein BU25DRAFT_461833 [Macroventuria anomochaeta]
MTTEQVDMWFKKNSIHKFLNSKMNLWQRKMRLQRAFGGFGESTINKEAAGQYSNTCDDTQQGWPTHTNELFDFAHIDAPTFTNWYKPNCDELKAKLQERGKKHGMDICCAILHIKSKRTFLHEPGSNFSSAWINDSTVFDTALTQEILAIPNVAVRNGEIRCHMMAAYESDMLNKIEDSTIHKPGVPNILDINIIGASQSTIAAEYPVVDDSLIRPMTAEDTHTAKRHADRKRGKKRRS